MIGRQEALKPQTRLQYKPNRPRCKRDDDAFKISDASYRQLAVSSTDEMLLSTTEGRNVLKLLT
jgi:hypothetical protein